MPPWAWSVFAGSLLMLPAGCGGGQPAGGAGPGKELTTVTDTFEVGPSGGNFKVPVRGAPTDGVSLQVPENAVDRQVTVSLGYSTAPVKVNAGTPAGVVFIVGVNPEVTLQQPLRIGVSFQPNSKYLTLVGYKVSAEGRLRPVDTVDLDMKAGRATFLTFQPLSLTWVYVTR
jgi:hypothetical protein